MSTLACLAWIYFTSLESSVFVFVSKRTESFVAGELLLYCKTSPTAKKMTGICVHPKGGRHYTSLVAQFPCVVNPVHSIPLGISKMNKRSLQISCPLWNFPQIEACVDCLINLLHVGNIVFLLMRRLSHCPFWSCFIIKWWLGMLLLLLRNCFLLAKHATSFSCVSTTSQRPLRQTMTVDMVDNFRKWFFAKVTFIIQNSNIKML